MREDTASPSRSSAAFAAASLLAAGLVGLGEAILIDILRDVPLDTHDSVSFVARNGLLWLLAVAPLALLLSAVPAVRQRGGRLAFWIVLAPGLAVCLAAAAKRLLPALPGRANLAVDAGLILLSALWILHCWRRPPAPASRGLARAAVVTLLTVLLANLAITAYDHAKRRRDLARLPTARPGLPDVVLVTFDTVRRDRMSLHGGPAETPNLERLAQEGVLLGDHVAQAPLTGPSHFAILSSAYTALERWGWRLPPNAPGGFAADILGRVGYRTGAFVSAVPLRPSVSGTRFGFDTFDAVFNVLDRLHARLDATLPARVLENLGLLNYLERDAASTTDAALAWVDGLEGRPFLLWVHYYDPHEPHPTPPAVAVRYHRQPGEPPWPLPPGVEGVHRAGSIERYDAEARAYAYEIHYADQQLGRLLAGLAAHGRLDQTLVVATADHGELIGDHGGYYDHRGAWEPVVQVFATLRFPDGMFRGSRIAAQTRSVDLFPTVFDALGLDAPPGLAGVSLLPLLRGERAEQAAEAFIDAGRAWAIRSPPWKYVVDLEGVERLYHIEERPERTDWRRREPELARRLAERLRALRTPTAPLVEGVDPAALERLRALGYGN